MARTFSKAGKCPGTMKEGREMSGASAEIERAKKFLIAKRLFCRVGRKRPSRPSGKTNGLCESARPVREESLLRRSGRRANDESAMRLLQSAKSRLSRAGCRLSPRGSRARSAVVSPLPRGLFEGACAVSCRRCVDGTRASRGGESEHFVVNVTGDAAGPTKRVSLSCLISQSILFATFVVLSFLARSFLFLLNCS